MYQVISSVEWVLHEKWTRERQSISTCFRYALITPFIEERTIPSSQTLHLGIFSHSLSLIISWNSFARETDSLTIFFNFFDCHPDKSIAVWVGIFVRGLHSIAWSYLWMESRDEESCFMMKIRAPLISDSSSINSCCSFWFHFLEWAQRLDILNELEFVSLPWFLVSYWWSKTRLSVWFVCGMIWIEIVRV